MVGDQRTRNDQRYRAVHCARDRARRDQRNDPRRDHGRNVVDFYQRLATDCMISSSSKVSLSSKAMKLEGVPQMVKTLNDCAQTLSGEAKNAFSDKTREIAMKPANAIRDEAKDMVPVVTGTLRDAIFAGPLKERVGALIGVKGVFYAAWVEYGTQKMPAHPFF